MAETLVENQICQACGAAVRPGSLFCYGCGKSLEPKNSVALNNDTNALDASLPEKSRELNNNGDIAENQQWKAEKVADKPIVKPEFREKAELKSAAAMRRKSKIYQPKKTEIIWEEYEGGHGWFLLVAIILALLAGGIFYLAIYLK